MIVNSVCWIFLAFFVWSKGASAQFDFMQTPITDTVKFNHEYDFIVIGAGSGQVNYNYLICQKKDHVMNFKYLNMKYFAFLLHRWLCNGKQIE